ncbi:hypothetical protein DEAC_c14330 [Desulfosporosinus acididurans]|uniref:Uncharacterized protein n=1 Tax=Desulfosporosinus acididurans TaxID=476652 RepID=A0A0J1FTG3_9FIRM|nr:hypothetical protein [Desulfosporosinus acididurans]KLU66765.1 hypothetical protein DEAC_c14330 [Desulfosporosinus acididurans]
MIDLTKYLPEFYRKSTTMQAIQRAIGPAIPDGISYLWQVFFLSTCPDEYLYLWQNELGAQSRDDMFAKLRGTRVLNRELAEDMGIDLFETYRASPEAGYTLSGSDAVFPDGVHYAPLITDVIIKPEDIQVTRRMIDIMSASGFLYWFSVKVSEYIGHEIGGLTGSQALYPGIIFPSDDGMLSGSEIRRKVVLSLNRQDKLTVIGASPKTAPVVAYDGLLLKFTEFGALDIIQNVDDLLVDDASLDEEADGTELFSALFETGPVSSPAINNIWNGYSFKSKVPQSLSIEQNQVGITVAAEPIRNEWSRAVSFLEPGVSFLETNMKAQYSSIKVEVG